MASPSSPASPVKDNADYVLAVEQLARGAFAERRAAVDTLVGLADGYLADTSLDKNTRNTNAQHIINRLCEYIRSPYALAGEYDVLTRTPVRELPAEQEPTRYRADRDALAQEAQVRGHILGSIHERVQYLRRAESDTPQEALEALRPGRWSHLTFDFTGADFFYPAYLSESYWGAGATFTGCTYRDKARADGSVYCTDADFSGSTYQKEADFSECKFLGTARFTQSTYNELAFFSGAIFAGDAHLSGCTYVGVFFQGCFFFGQVNLSECVYDGPAQLEMNYYSQAVDFSGCTYNDCADFYECLHGGPVTFTKSVCGEGANCGGSIYLGGADFSGTRFSTKPYFEGTVFADGTVNRFLDSAPNTPPDGARWVSGEEYTQWQQQREFIEEVSSIRQVHNTR